MRLKCVLSFALSALVSCWLVFLYRLPKDGSWISSALSASNATTSKTAQALRIASPPESQRIVKEDAAPPWRTREPHANRSQRCKPHSILPRPVAYEVLGDDLRELSCSNKDMEEAEACCAEECRGEPACALWYLNGDGRCKLRSNFKGIGDGDSQEQPRSHWKYPAKLSMQELFPTSRSLEEDLRELRRELQAPCPEPTWNPGLTSRSAETVHEWVKWALAQEDGQVRRFPEHNMLLSTKTCHDPELEDEDKLPWFLMSRATEPVLDDDVSRSDVPGTVSNLVAKANRAVFGAIHKPGCPNGPGSWYHYKVAEPLPRSIKGSVKPEGVAILDADIWSNIGHSLQHLAWLDATFRSDALKMDILGEVELVATWQGRGMSYGKLIEMVLSALKLPDFVLPDDKGKTGGVRCYNVVAQRLFMHSVHQPDYSFARRVVNSCNLDGRMQRKALLWYKAEAGHAMFTNLADMNCSMQHWCKSVKLDLSVTELNKEEVADMTACDQVSIFSRLALLVAVHGAGGVHSMWLPPEAVFIEMSPNKDAKQRLSSFGYYSELAAMSGALYSHFQYGLAGGYTSINNGVAKYYSFDVENDLIPFLTEIYESWLKPRLAASAAMWPSQQRSPPPCTSHQSTGRCVPGFLLLGPQKTGTSTLFQLFKLHPQIFLSKSKEPQFFNRKCENAEIEKYPTLEKYLEILYPEQQEVAADKGITGECSATYLFCMCCPAYVKSVAPNVRLLVNLRNPITRSYSRYVEISHAKKDPNAFTEAFNPEEESRNAFAEFIDQQLPKLSACLDSAAGGSTVDRAQCAARNQILGWSLYDLSMKVWLEHFEAKNFLVTYTEVLAENPGLAMRSIEKHFGIKAHDYGKQLYHSYNARGHYGWGNLLDKNDEKAAHERVKSTESAISAPTFKRMYEFFRPHVVDMKYMADAGLITALPDAWLLDWNLTHGSI